MDAQVRHAFLEGRELAAVLAVGEDWCHESAPQILTLGISHRQSERFFGEPCDQQGDGDLTIRPGGERPLQALAEGARPDVDRHDVIPRRPIHDDIDLVDTRSGDVDGRCSAPGDIQLDAALRLRSARVGLVAIVVAGGLDRHLQHSRTWQFAYRHG